MQQTPDKELVLGVKPASRPPSGPKVYSYLRNLAGNAEAAVKQTVEAFPEAVEWFPTSKESILRNMKQTLDLLHRLAWAVALNQSTRSG